MRTGMVVGIDKTGAGKPLTDLVPVTEALETYKAELKKPAKSFARVEIWTKNGRLKSGRLKPAKAKSKKATTKPATA